MTTAYTSLLGLALPVQGELQGTWGDTVNNAITSLLDTAVAGTTTLSTDGDVTLTTTTGAANQARQAILLCSGARTAQRTITAPAQSKIYTVINNTTGGFAVKLVGVGPTTGVTIPAGSSGMFAWNGSDFVDVSNYVNGNKVINGNLTVNGNTTLGDAAGDTLTVNAGTTTFVQGTANGVAYLNGSKVLTTGSALTFDGTNLNLGGTSQRITGDFSNATTANRALVQTSTLNNNTTFGIIPNGTGTTANFAAYGNAADLANSSVMFLGISGSGTEVRLQSSRSGTGTYLPMTFYTDGSEQMRLTSTGLGIGTSSLNSRLEINASTSAASRIRLKYNDTPYCYFGGYSGIVGSGNADDVALFAWTGKQLMFGTDATERMRLDAAGNLGLGVTPSAWGSGFKALQLTGGSVVSAFDRVWLSQNTFYNSAGQDTYISTGPASSYRQYNGTHSWWISPSGTGGTTISTVTQAMALAQDGNNTYVNFSGTGLADAVQLYTGYSGTSSYLAFGTKNSGTLSEKMRLDASGNLLVNQTSQVSNNVASKVAILAGGNTNTTIQTMPQGLSISNATNQPTTGYGVAMRFQFSTGSDGIGKYAAIAGLAENIYANSTALAFYTTSDAAGGVDNVAERARITSGGDLLVGTTSATYGPSGGRGVVEINGSTNSLLALKRNNTNNFYIQNISEAVYINNTASTPIVFTVNGAERARITPSGFFLVNTTSSGYQNANCQSLEGSVGYGVFSHVDGTASGTLYIAFGYGGNGIGSITQNGTTSVAYNTSSDYRLKEDIQPMTGALAKVAALKPCTYKWKADGSDGEGFIAHELAEVVPQCVTGEKDAVDAEGKPVYQGIDTSFLVATLTAAIQEQQAIIDSLKARLDAANL